MLDTMKEALDVDSSLHTHPVSVEVHNPAQINDIVDKITYHKVNRMVIVGVRLWWSTVSSLIECFKDTAS